MPPIYVAFVYSVSIWAVNDSWKEEKGRKEAEEQELKVKQWLPSLC